MSEKRGVNKEHPDFEKYKKEFELLVEEMSKEEEETEIIHSNFQGLDGPVSAVHKKYHVLIMKLQKKYAYLFPPETQKRLEKY